MADLLEKLKKAGNIKCDVIEKSTYFTEREMIKTDLPILNIAFSGELDKGFSNGITVIAGQSRSFKSLLCIYCMKAYLDKYDDAIVIFYDSEFGTPPAYLTTFGVDVSRVIHIPVTNVEEMKFDLVSRLNAIERGDHVFIMNDSLGNLASKKEWENAINENTAKDMQRAQEIKSMFRIVTPHLSMKNIPFFVINHVYSEMGGLYAKTVISGGSGILLSANTAFIISKSQEKVGTDIVGYNFNINIEKSRFVREKSKLTFQVLYESGISKYSGLLDIAMESGHVIKPSNGWYSRVDKETGEVEEKKYRLKDTNTEEFWKKILEAQSFNDFVVKRYKLCSSNMNDEEVEQNLEESENE